MRTLLSKRTDTSFLSLLFFALLFLFPLQQRMTKWLKPLSKIAFQEQTLPQYFLENRLDYFLSDFLLIALILTSLKTVRTWTLSFSEKFLLIFIAISLFSIFFSSCASELWPYYRWFQLALPILGFFLIGKTASIKEKITTCFWILFWSGLLQCLFAIGQYFLQDSLGLKFFGEVKIRVGESAHLFIPNKTRWLIDHLFHYQNDSALLIRPSGTFPHPNILGGFLGMTIFASLFLFAPQMHRRKKVLISSGIVLQIFSLFLTFSRGALFGLIGGSLLLAILLVLYSYKKLALQLSVLILASSALSTTLLYEQIAHRGGIVNYNELAKNSDHARLYFQRLALSMSRKNPLMGAGYGQFLLEIEPDNPNTEVQKVHNIYLLILGETGILGLLSFVGFIAILLYSTWKRKVDLQKITLFTIFVYFLWIGCIDHYLITTHYGVIMFFATATLLTSYGDGRKVKRSPQIQAS